MKLIDVPEAVPAEYGQCDGVRVVWLSGVLRYSDTIGHPVPLVRKDWFKRDDWTLVEDKK